MDLPKGSRASGTWPVPVRGPHVHKMATGKEPMTVPDDDGHQAQLKPEPEDCGQGTREDS